MMVELIHSVETIVTDSELEALILETNLIKKYKPKYNSMLKDDKSYIWLMFDKRVPFPIPQIVREKRVKNADYLGPFSNTMPVRRILRMLRKIFPYCTDKEKLRRSSSSKFKKEQLKPCFHYYLDLCEGICVREESKSEYRKKLSQIKRFFKNEKNEILKEMTSKMRKTSALKDYEQAAKLRDKILDLEYISQRITIDQRYDEDLFKKDKSDRAVKALEELIGKLDKLSLVNQQGFKIECYDISNIQGKYAVGSMVVFVDGKPSKKLYRKFKIKTKDTPDDFLMMKEVLKRRFSIDNKKRGDESFRQEPDLIIIDGGKGQLSSAYKVLSDLDLEVAVIGLAKKFEEVFMIEPSKDDEGWEFIKRTMRRGSESKFLVQRIRDESHRFAINYHRNLRSTGQTKSVLDSIPGVGKLTRNRLLKAFGSVEGVRKAKDEELQQVIKNRSTLTKLRRLL